MMRYNILKDSPSYNSKLQTIELIRTQNLQHRININKKDISKVKQNRMANTNSHRKIRNSREYNRNPEVFPNNTIYSSRTTHHIQRKLCQCLQLILMLILCCSMEISFAIIHRSHSSAAIAFTLPSTSTTIKPSSSNELITSTSRYSKPFTVQQQYKNDDDSFHPIIPKDINLESISQNIFTKDGKYRVFENVDSDLRAQLAMRRKDDYVDIDVDGYDTYDVLTFPVNDRKGFPKQDIKLQSKHINKTIIKSKQQQQQHDETPNLDENKIHQTQKSSSTFEQTTPKNTIINNYQHLSYNETIEDQRQTSITNKKQFSSNMFNPEITNKTNTITPTNNTKDKLASELKDLENLLSEYLDELFNKGRYQPKPELVIALQKNFTQMTQGYEQEIGKFLPKSRTVRQAIKRTKNGELSVNIPRSLDSGRLLFFAGLKKVMWPVYMGLQVMKSLMLALLLPTIIGSFGKLLGKGISSGSAPLFIRPMDEPQDLDFRDNNFNFDDDSNKFTLVDDGSGNVKDTGYAYNQPEASQAHNQYAAAINQHALSRYSLNERQQLMQDSYLSAIQSLGAASFKNSNSLASGSSSSGLGGLAGLRAPTRQKPAAPANMNTFQQFQKVPASSLLLSNYDPFYSPLLSRLDSVFAQLKLNSDDEDCREKLICSMYANPAKYAPYSNLVSAQLSRELNELRKPTSDNPDILRFFKYMRAAKDGQDGIDCEKTFDKCKEFKDFENPAMVSTYHDINKLVQARKIS